ncbi:hypothetical protein VTO73DRAFT_5350 [Trametes versicolor]
MVVFIQHSSPNVHMCRRHVPAKAFSAPRKTASLAQPTISPSSAHCAVLGLRHPQLGLSGAPSTSFERHARGTQAVLVRRARCLAPCHFRGLLCGAHGVVGAMTLFNQAARAPNCERLHPLTHDGARGAQQNCDAGGMTTARPRHLGPPPATSTPPFHKLRAGALHLERLVPAGAKVPSTSSARRGLRAEAAPPTVLRRLPHHHHDPPIRPSAR